MKASELRIGNVLYFGDPTTTIEPVYFYIEGGHSIQAVEHGVDVRPIPITEEWLLKFGFTFDVINEGDRPTYYLDGKEFYIDADTLQPTDCGFPITRVEINFVHQLQNLYFALTGEELNAI